MTNFAKLFIQPLDINYDFIRRTCFLNNIRSKFLTISLIICALIFAFYDLMIAQKVLEYNVFLLHLKADVILLVFSFIFTLYVFFSQVKTHNNIQNHHKYIHGIISLFILIWSAFKSVLFIKYSNGNFNLSIIAILLTSFLYLFPFIVYTVQLVLNLIFSIFFLLLFHLTLYEIINRIYVIIIISLIVFFISRYIYYLQHKILLKEREVLKYRKKMNTIN